MLLYIDPKEVLRYLGYRNQNLPSNIKELITKAISETQTLIQPKSTYQRYQLIRKSGNIFLEQTSIILPGQDITNHLSYSQACIVMAVTLGARIETKIRYYETINLTKALVLDACASAAVEQIIDNLCNEIDTQLKRENLCLTSRYSPGYGDLPLELQPDFITLLNANRTIGLHASQHSLLQPRKSVTAIAGITQIDQPVTKRNCCNCTLYQDCQLRKDNDSCGH